MSPVMLAMSFLLSKVGRINPATRSKAIEIINAAQKAGHRVRFVWGMGGGNEHGSGNALDLMVYDEAAGDFIRNYVWHHRRRFGLIHVIWEQHITSTRVQPGVRRKMADRGSPTENHMDHPHIWFDSTPYTPPVSPAVPPAIPKPPVAKPTVKVRVLKKGMRGEDVRQLQREMNRVFPGYPGADLKLDGSFGPATERQVKEFQRRTGLSRDGVVGPKTRAKMKASGLRLI